MEQSNISALLGYKPAKIVDINDPEKRGRIKVRLFDQDERFFPDEKLPWAFVQEKGQAQTGGVGQFSTANYVVGGWISAKTDPVDGQTLYVEGSISSPGEKKQDGSKTTSTGSSSGQSSEEIAKKGLYVPPTSMGLWDWRHTVTKEGSGNLNSLEDIKIDYKQDNTIKWALDESNGEKAKHSAKLAIGGATANNKQEVLDTIKKEDPQNTSGSVQPSVDIMKKLLKNNGNTLNALKGAIGQNSFNMIKSLLNKKGGGSGGSSSDNTPKEGDPCMIDDKPGVLRYSNNLLTCVVLVK